MASAASEEAAATARPLKRKRGTPMSEIQNTRHVVSITTGCHSTYLLLRMVEENMPIDAVLFADTGMEFPEAYKHLECLDE